MATPPDPTSRTLARKRREPGRRAAPTLVDEGREAREQALGEAEMWTGAWMSSCHRADAGAHIHSSRAVVEVALTADVAGADGDGVVATSASKVDMGPDEMGTDRVGVGQTNLDALQAWRLQAHAAIWHGTELIAVEGTEGLA